MKVEQRCWTPSIGWDVSVPRCLDDRADLVLAFGSKTALQEPTGRERLKAECPNACLIGCSTAGEIHGTRVVDNVLAVTAIDFEQAELQKASTEIRGANDSYDAGRRLAEALLGDGLTHVLVLCDGLHVNGEELTRGLAASLPAGVAVTGGLSADGDNVQQTLVLLDGSPQQDTAAAIGFYGNRLKVTVGSMGGWQPFGPERIVTRAEGSVLHELDGRPALALYESYLGDFAGGLPASSLLFPLSLRTDDPTRGIIRTVQAIDRERQTITLAGEIPVGAYARIMQASTDKLVGGAAAAASECISEMGNAPDFALLISGAGRRLLMKQRVEEELEAVRDVFGSSTRLAGFYSYGEIAPFCQGERPELHNLTMTVTGFSEN
ncbi:MAG TPA: FIST N-terminal domain-containing protein [Tepidisphaeraceae bacterium]